MKKNKGLVIMGLILMALTFVVMSFTSCKEEQKPDVQKLDKHGTIDIKLRQIDDGINTIIVTEESIYYNNGVLFKTLIKYDTVPSLGIVRDTLDTGRTITRKDEDGDDYEDELDTVIVHPKQYQFFIAVKPNKQ
jgi:hypothetical protein